jgi:DNA polymerase-1
MKMAMIKVQEELEAKYPNSKMLLQIHDSVLVESPAGEAEAVAELLQNTMQDIYKLPVRLDVDVTIGDNWGEL